MKRIYFVVLFALIALCGLQAQNTTETFKPHGKPFAKIFSNLHSSYTNGNGAPAFELQRAYFGYEYKFNKEFSAKVNFDISNPGTGSLQMSAFVKNALIKYKKNQLTVQFGLIGMNQFKIQEKAWGYRYIQKSFQDAYKLGSSADLGASISYKFTDFISADLTVMNGEGYKKLQADSTFKTGFGITLSPLKGFTIRGYYDYMKDREAQQTMATFVGYKNSHFSVGAEYNKQKNYKMTKGKDFSGVSLYSSVKVTKKMKIFGRYDKLKSDTMEETTEAWNLDKDGQLYMAGIEYSPIKGLKLSPNFQAWNPRKSDKDFITSAYLNLEIKF